MANKVKGKIFYIDDEKELQEYFTFVLAKYGYELTTYGDWNDSLFDSLVDFDMIILDLMFRDKSFTGIDLCRLIKSKDNLKHIPVYIFSAKVFFENKRKARDAGANGFLEKPIKLDALIKTIEKEIGEK